MKLGSETGWPSRLRPWAQCSSERTPAVEIAFGLDALSRHPKTVPQNE